MKYETKDSGKRVDYPSGMRRDTQEGKADYTLIPEFMLTRWAELMTRGAEKYGRNNYQLANSQDELDRFKASAFRHFVQWQRGDNDEDHGAAVFFNITAAEMVKGKLSDPKLDPKQASIARAKADMDTEAKRPRKSLLGPGETLDGLMYYEQVREGKASAPTWL